MKKRKIVAYSFGALIAIGIGLYITGLGGRLLMSGITPIIAHPERYTPIQNDIKNLEKLEKFVEKSRNFV